MLENLFKKFFNYSTAGPALTRYYVMPHVKIHRIHSSDESFHTHPWNGVSFIFGKYRELHKDSKKAKLRILFNFVKAHKAHRVIVHKPVWTLFINFRRINENWHYGDDEKPWEGSDQERNKKK